MIRILQISNKAPYPANDGSSIAIYNMANGLCENGAEVHLITINTKKHFKPNEGIPQEFKTRTHYQSIFHNSDTSLTGAFLNLFSSESYFVSRFYFETFNSKLIETLQKISFDIVQLEGLFMGDYIETIRKHSTAKIVLRAHNVEHLIWDRYIVKEKNWFIRTYLNLQNKRLKRYEEKIFKSVDAIVTITDADKEVIHSMNKNVKLFTCITGVNLSDYDQKTGVKKIEQTLFYFGSMDWIPNQEAVDWFLAKCWPSILKTNPNCKFIIAGSNMPKKYKTIHLSNVLPIENILDKREFYSKYDIMLVPLLSGSGLRIKIIEGLSFGKAIVSTSIGAEGIYITPNEHLIIADSPENYIKEVNSLLASNEKKKLLEKNAKNFAVSNLDNKIITAKLVEFYNTF